MLSAIQTFQIFNRDIERTRAVTASEPKVQRDTEYFLENIQKIKTAEEFVSNYRVFSYAMNAYNLGDMVYAKGFMQKLLSESIYDQSSVMNNLSDPRFLEFAKAFNFGDQGEVATLFSSANTKTSELYIEHTMEQNAGAQNEGARLGLYFQRQASSVSSVIELFADKALYKVLQTTFNLPTSTGGALNSQIKTVERQLDIEDLQDPKKLERFITRFGATWDAQNTIAPSAQGNLFASYGYQPVTISLGLLSDIQNQYHQY